MEDTKASIVRLGTTLERAGKGKEVSALSHDCRHCCQYDTQLIISFVTVE